LWRIGIPQGSTWSQRKILKLRESARNFIKFEVGDGKDIHLWMDRWHPVGILNENYGFRVIYNAQSNLDAGLSTVLINGNRVWKPTRSEDLAEIQGRLLEISIGACDKLIWIISKKKKYSSSDTWEAIRMKN